MCRSMNKLIYIYCSLIFRCLIISKWCYAMQQMLRIKRVEWKLFALNLLLNLPHCSLFRFHLCKQWGIIPLPPGTLGQYQPIALGLDSLVQARVSRTGGYLGIQTTQIGVTSNLINIYWQITSYYNSIHGYRSQVPLMDTHRQS